MNKNYVYAGISAVVLGVVGYYLFIQFRDRNREKIQEGSFEIIVK